MSNPGSARRVALIAALLALTVACEPSGPPPLIGAGCHFSVSVTSRTINFGSGSSANAAAFGAYFWNETNSEGPKFFSGSASHLDVYTYTNAVNVNSGYLSTSGPPSGFAAPTCGSASWSTKPNVWINSTKVDQRISIGEAYWNYSTTSHELGHALGLGHNHNEPCSDVTIMESGSQHGYVDCGVYAPKTWDWQRVNDIYV